MFAVFLGVLLLVEICRANQCPCVFPGFQPDLKLFVRNDEKLQICMETNTYSQLEKFVSAQNQTSSKYMSIFTHRLFNIRSQIDQTCDVSFSIPTEPLSKLMHDRRMCPEKCAPIPTVEIPSDLFSSQFASFFSGYAATCTLTFQGEIIPKWNKSKRAITEKYGSWLAFILYEISLRRYMECHETSALYRYAFPRHLSTLVNDSKRVFHSPSPDASLVKQHSLSSSQHSRPLSSIFSKRKISGMVVWIGTRAKYQLMESQALILEKEDFHNDNAIIGWAATDDLYPCSDESIKCSGGNKKYQGLLPQSNINFMPKGWGCAQRRPLRALSHILLFYSIQSFLILLDDDTFFNYPLFYSKYLSAAFSTSTSFYSNFVSSSTVYYGEALGATGEKGHLSKEGFFVGGSGYLFNKKVLEKLSDKEVISFGVEKNLDRKAEDTQRSKPWNDWLKSHDPYRSEHHMKHLSLLEEGMEYSQRHCQIYSQQKDNSSGLFSASIPAMHKKYSCISSRVISRNNEEDIQQIMNQTETMPLSVRNEFSDKFIRVPISLRLIDFCTNLLANEHTCQHRQELISFFLSRSISRTIFSVLVITLWEGVYFTESELLPRMSPVTKKFQQLWTELNFKHQI
jgi:hypothetical protein